MLPGAPIRTLYAKDRFQVFRGLFGEADRRVGIAAGHVGSLLASAGIETETLRANQLPPAMHEQGKPQRESINGARHLRSSAFEPIPRLASAEHGLAAASSRIPPARRPMLHARSGSRPRRRGIPGRVQVRAGRDWTPTGGASRTFHGYHPSWQQNRIPIASRLMMTYECVKNHQEALLRGPSDRQETPLVAGMNPVGKTSGFRDL